VKILISLDNLNIDNVIFGKMKSTENNVTHVNMSNKIVTYINYFDFDSIFFSSRRQCGKCISSLAFMSTVVLSAFCL
jgi:hypothetical protein